MNKGNTDVCEYLVELTESYYDIDRDCSDGHMNLGTSLNLSDDLHSYNFLLKFKLEYVFKDPTIEESSDDDEPKADEDPKPSPMISVGELDSASLSQDQNDSGEASNRDTEYDN